MSPGASIFATFLVIAMLGCGSGGGDGDRPSPTATGAPTPIVEPTPTPEPTPIATATARARLFVLTYSEPGAFVTKRLVFSDDLGETWEVARGTGLSNDAIAFAFADRDHGVAVGGSVAQRTSDGGRTWTTQLKDSRTAPDDRLFLVSVMIDASGQAVAFGNLQVQEFAHADGYESWQLPADGSAPQLGNVGAGGSAAIASMCVSADGVGVAAGSRIQINSEIGSSSTPTVFVTADGGASWTLGPTSVNRVGTVVWTGTACVGANDLWLAGGYFGGYRAILHSTDGGATWTDQSKFDETGVGGFVDVAFVDERTGWAVGFGDNQSQPLIAHTTDGGADWTPQVVPPGVIGVLGSVAFLDEDLGIAGGGAYRSPETPATALITDDGGINWRKLDLPSGLGNVLRVGLAR